MKKRYFFILILVASFVVVVTLSLQTYSKIFTYDLKANVTKLRINNSKMLLGISNDPNEINFGVIPENVTVKKFINLTNFRKENVKVKIFVKGNIKDFIKLDDKEFELKSGEIKLVGVVFNATKVGYYKGKINIELKIPKYPYLAMLTSWLT